MAYKVGQKVKVREDMSLSKHQEKYRGKFVTIKEVRIGDVGAINTYKTEESGRLLWYGGQLEPVEEEKKMRNIDVIAKDETLLIDGVCRACYIFKNGKSCLGIKCSECEFAMPKHIIDFLNAEYKPKIVLNKFEYDLLVAYNFREDYCTFNYFDPLKAMKAKGYFKNVTDTSMKVKDILDNCEIKEE